MDQIFAPWRIEWVENEDKNPHIDDCVFCELPDMNDDKRYLILARNDHAYTILNNYPYSLGHTLIVPFQHTGDYTDLDESELLDFEKMKTVMIETIDRTIEPDFINIGMNLGESAGGSLSDHLHTHIVPRWNDDTKKRPQEMEDGAIEKATSDIYKKYRADLKEKYGSSNGECQQSIMIKNQL